MKLSRGPSNTGAGKLAQFTSLLQQIRSESSHTGKTEVIERFLASYQGSVYLLFKLLLTKEDKRVYNIRDKQLAKLMAQLLDMPVDSVRGHLAKSGSMAETAAYFFSKASYLRPQAVSTLSLAEVDAFLDKFTEATTEADQTALLAKVLARATAEDLETFLLLLNHDVRARIGTHAALKALGVEAVSAYRHSADLKLLIDRMRGRTPSSLAAAESGGPPPSSASNFTLMKPIKPMLARACKSVDEAFRRVPQGMYAEIKYDGERIQIHKNGSSFAYYSRNLKPVLSWKTAPIEQFVLNATSASTIVLDGEILLVDTASGAPLPFAMFSKHKNANFASATVCLFIFDILYLDGVPLLDKPISERRALLKQHLTVVPNRIQLSELTEIHQEADLTSLMNRVIRQGLEGLVLKAIDSVYTPAARHWLKIKKDYLKGMADTADLVVLGAYYGKGSNGGLLTTFLMGSFDPATALWKTVCKVGSFDDAGVAELQTRFLPLMDPLAGPNARAIPPWLDVHSVYAPDFVVRDPMAMPVWEVEGAEFSISSHHTANGISIRFPRFVRERTDKSVADHTSLPQLVALRDASVSGNVLALRDRDSGSASRSASASASATSRKRGAQAAITQFANPAKKARGLLSSPSGGVAPPSSPPPQWTVPVASPAAARPSAVNYVTATLANVLASDWAGGLAASGKPLYVVAMVVDAAEAWSAPGSQGPAVEAAAPGAKSRFAAAGQAAASLGAITFLEVAPLVTVVTVGCLDSSAAVNTAAVAMPGFVTSIYTSALAKVAARAYTNGGAVVVPEVRGGVVPYLDRAALYKALQDTTVARRVVTIVAGAAGQSTPAPAPAVGPPQVAPTGPVPMVEETRAPPPPVAPAKRVTKPLVHKRVVLSVKDAEKRRKVVAAVRAMGAEVQEAWRPSGINASHFMIALNESRSATEVRELGAPVVGMSLLEHLMAGHKLPSRLELISRWTVSNADAETAAVEARPMAVAQPVKAQPVEAEQVEAPAAAKPASAVFAGVTVLLYNVPAAEYSEVYRYLVAHEAEVLNAEPDALDAVGDVASASVPGSGLDTIVVGDGSGWDAVLAAIGGAHPQVRVKTVGWVWASIKAGAVVEGHELVR
ncbi:DNA ligase [Thecamonas trahens ATCC 50062]|uniref:DNA ligase n=1 Tax=Thecamonas trahens ATCC 50062 TaxID=461836 RepID=A0A0L0D1C1_THETB|nr:DNA ligase [Thecamonas trahens ATCC 50062]KNC45925.1 DNA ligase [Thecamonas trahens ATCC 50062]|eukprot:XP_013762908.1 DNA ligase [Thecamonas trahens ATCC 50062]